MRGYSVYGIPEIILSLGGTEKNTGGNGTTAAPGLDVKASSHQLRSAITKEGNS